MHYTLLIATQDNAGLVYKISRILYEAGANIERQDEYVDRENGLFFMRTSFVVGSTSLDSRADLKCQAQNLAQSTNKNLSQRTKSSTKTHPLTPSAKEGENRELAYYTPHTAKEENRECTQNYTSHTAKGGNKESTQNSHTATKSSQNLATDSDISTNSKNPALDSRTQDALEATLIPKLKSALPNGAKISLKKAGKKSLIILATKENHCLGDLLLRQESGELNADIKAVIANRAELKSLVERFSIPFFWVDSDGISREEHEGKIGEIIERFSPDLLALAKYMRILSSDFTSRYEGKIINIHHSFLPAFIGANPYKQAFARGVKIIGATAHFVTNELDEGPIIAQDIIHINHTYSWQDMQKAGRDVEKSVFAHALDLVLHDRVFINGNKTIVF